MKDFNMQKINPFLWFDHQAEEAANFYVSIFPNSRILKIVRYGAAAAKTTGKPAGSVMTVKFLLDGQKFAALNGGPQFNFSPAISFVANCQTQAEVDSLWEKLSAGGEEWPCAWLKDRYGVSWQIVPAILIKLLEDEDQAKAGRVMRAMLKMSKIDIKTLKQASAGPKARKK
jgi:predicted 3-demethylubiquinone-9 3-methyltransferase (glyoxalase superfamily)